MPPADAALAPRGEAALSPPADAATCAHCGLPVPPARQAADAAAYCCDGCEAVAGALASMGLAHWYELRESSGAVARPARTTGRRHAEMDEAEFLRLHARDAGGGLLRIELRLDGVHCAACVWLVERLPALVDGVVEARLDFGHSLCRLTFDPARTSLSAVARTLDSLGYPPHPWRSSAAQESWKREQRRLLVRLAVAGAAASNAMLLAIALYAGEASGMEDGPRTLLRAASLLVATVSLAWPGSTFFRGALGALRARRLHVDVPVALALGLAYLGSAVHVVRDAGAVWFDSLAALVFLLLVGRYVQARAQRRAFDAAGVLAALSPTLARQVSTEGAALGEPRIREVPAASLRPGDLVEVRAGDSVPVDGEVVTGRAEMDCSLLTGESRPTLVAPGQRVHAGTVATSSRLLVRVESVGEATRLGRLAALVEHAERERPPMVLLADRIAGWFVAAVLVLAAATLVLAWPLGPGEALGRAVALLVVTCPCALALATPLAFTAALGRAARLGILVKGAGTFERLAVPSLVLLDKTGTLTEGRLRVVEWHGDESARPLVAALEAGSAHPVARALAQADAGGLTASDARQEPGAGIEGTVAGRHVVVGTLAHVQVGLHEPAARGLLASAASLAAAGRSPLFVAVDGRLVAVAGLGDPLRADAAAGVAALQALGHRVGILSGDHPLVVASVAAQLGIPEKLTFAQASPEEKLGVIRRAGITGPVVMVGDGANDAAALAAAGVGIAVHGGAEASLAAADAFATTPGLAPVVALAQGARRTRGLVRLTVGLSLAYNAVGAALALAGLVHPLVAALLMPLSSLTVVTLAYRVRTFPAGAATENPPCR